jgi:hypothetical protein
MSIKKPIDPRVKEVLQELKFDYKECLWDCHGTWVMYHRYIEIAGATKGVEFDLYEVESNSKDGFVAIKCVARLGDKSIVTYGEACPRNCKNAYLYAMAEKRAVDRATLKLLGLHGFVYSDQEIDEDDSMEVKKEMTKIMNEKGIDDLKLYFNTLGAKAKHNVREYYDRLTAS